LAELRAKEATALARSHNQQGAYYLAGFAVECALKACIAKKTRRHDFPADAKHAGRVYSHDLTELLKLADLADQLDGYGGFSELAGRSAGMDQATLVKSDRLIEAEVLEALDRARVPVTLCEWNYVPELHEWQLIIATPWHDSKGPRTTYGAVVDALEKAGIYQRVPMRRVFLKSPGDSLVKLLQQEARTQWDGFVHIFRHHGNGKAQEYSLVFTPITREDFAPVRRFSTLDDLKWFLAKDLHLDLNSFQSALDEMRRSGAGSIYPVTLTTRQIKKLGLA
jgi:hypothetical protein